MITGSSIELIWHFAGYLHLTQDYVASRVRMDEIIYHHSQGDYRLSTDQHIARSDAPSDMSSEAIRVKYSPGAEGLSDIKWVDLPDYNPLVVSAAHAPDAYVDSFPKFLAAPNVELPSTGHGYVVQPIAEPQVLVQSQVEAPQTHAQSQPAPIYEMKYVDGGNDTIANLSQANVATDRDHFSDGTAEFDELTPVPSDQPIADMLAMAEEHNPTATLTLGDSVEYWTPAVIEQLETIAAGETEAQTIEPGRYVNGELQPAETAEPAPGTQEHSLPEPPVRDEASSGPGQVAETGGNNLFNAGLIADLNEAPATLVVGGDYYETNAILQTNILHNHDVVFDAGETPPLLDSTGSTLDNVANFVFDELVKQHGYHRGSISNLQVDIDYVDGDVMDVKSLTQSNYFEDGDVTVQTRFDSYSEIHTGDNGQANIARFADWGKQYDIIIVVGDYHSANIISQTNVILDNDLIGMSSSSDLAPTIFSGQNALENDATITKYGASSFGDINRDLGDLIDALDAQEEFDRDAWSDFYGASSGHLNVLFVTGNYYDLNVISQINVLADADLAIQRGFDGIQWLSTGGNTALNQASIVNAGGLYDQHLGGDQYEDSILLQANLVSDGSETITTDPTALVSELVAFMEHSPSDSGSDTITWANDALGHSDSFGHVLT